MLGLGKDPEDYFKVIYIEPGAELGKEKLTNTMLKSPSKKNHTKAKALIIHKARHPPITLPTIIPSNKIKISRRHKVERPKETQVTHVSISRYTLRRRIPGNDWSGCR